MAEIIFSKSAGQNDALFGKFVHPIKALIQNESNALEKKKTALDVLFNIEKSNRYAETVFDQTDFDTFQAATEGSAAEKDSYQLGFSKTIEHIAFMKEFVITKEMADDAKVTGMGTNMKAQPKGFVRAYYKTKVKLGAWALANATSASGTFNKATVDLTTGDGKPLFSNAHPYKKLEGTQSNYFYGANLCDSEAAFEKTLGLLANKLRNFFHLIANIIVKCETILIKEVVTFIIHGCRSSFQLQIAKLKITFFILNTYNIGIIDCLFSIGNISCKEGANSHFRGYNTFVFKYL